MKQYYDGSGGNNKLYQLEYFFSKNRVLLSAGTVLVLLALPFLGIGNYLLRILIMIGIYTILGQGLNILIGYTGLVSLGHAGFYGIGAYTATLLMLHLGMNFFLAALLGGSLSALCGALLCLPTLKLKGPYLSVVTLGFGEIVRTVFLNWDSVTNGTLGLRNIPRPTVFGFQLTLANYGIYYLMLVLVILVTLLCYLVINSKVGRALISIKEDELAATMMGIDTSAYKELAFALSAFITGLAGAFYASMISFIDPNSFTNDVSTLMVSIVILGGMGTLRGMFLGAAVLIAFPEMARFLMNYRFVFYGLVLILMMRFRPQGILGWKSQLPYRLPKKLRNMQESMGT
ncbi:MAG: branched-chain amino acid ABC transporter permease [Lachnospiraceae bacterium]|jgi:branched-chain amino acid transport system permease protein|nr:branched-chain amino acid ABC transporter permease [Lachnospiraceae bacterium]MCI8958863.1 branched-chain amino acid ABC transporter permease [Lachnospiraceae bacterium]